MDYTKEDKQQYIKSFIQGRVSPNDLLEIFGMRNTDDLSDEDALEDL